ncbi:MAG TPA: hypothetical protein VIQ30_15515 [Pseudonocardia sp.]
MNRHLVTTAAQVCAIAGLMFLGLAVTGVVLLIFILTAGVAAGEIAAAVTVVVFIALRALLPVAIRRNRLEVD